MTLVCSLFLADNLCSSWSGQQTRCEAEELEQRRLAGTPHRLQCGPRSRWGHDRLHHHWPLLCGEHRRWHHTEDALQPLLCPAWFLPGHTSIHGQAGLGASRPDLALRPRGRHGPRSFPLFRLGGWEQPCQADVGHPVSHTHSVWAQRKRPHEESSGLPPSLRAQQQRAELWLAQQARRCARLSLCQQR